MEEAEEDISKLLRQASDARSRENQPAQAQPALVAPTKQKVGPALSCCPSSLVVGSVEHARVAGQKRSCPSGPTQPQPAEQVVSITNQVIKSAAWLQAANRTPRAPKRPSQPPTMHKQVRANGQDKEDSLEQPRAAAVFRNVRLNSLFV